jgi:hypothetical protein
MQSDAALTEVRRSASGEASVVVPFNFHRQNCWLLNCWRAPLRRALGRFALYAARCIDRIPFNECANDLALLVHRKAIHDGFNIRYRSRISQAENALDIRYRSRIIKLMAKKRKNPYAVALGRKGGRKGGPARAANMTPQERSESARNAVMARWAKVKQQNDR